MTILYGYIIGIFTAAALVGIRVGWLDYNEDDETSRVVAYTLVIVGWPVAVPFIVFYAIGSALRAVRDASTLEEHERKRDR